MTQERLNCGSEPQSTCRYISDPTASPTFGSQSVPSVHKVPAIVGSRATFVGVVAQKPIRHFQLDMPLSKRMGKTWLYATRSSECHTESLGKRGLKAVKSTSRGGCNPSQSGWLQLSRTRTGGVRMRSSVRCTTLAVVAVAVLLASFGALRRESRCGTADVRTGHRPPGSLRHCEQHPVPSVPPPRRATCSWLHRVGQHEQRRALRTRSGTCGRLPRPASRGRLVNGRHRPSTPPADEAASTR